MIHLQAMTPSALRDAVPGVSIEEARKIVGAIHRTDHLPGCVKMVRRSSLEAVRRAGTVPRLRVSAMHQSGVDPFVKYAFVTEDGYGIEAVRIPLERSGRFTVCVSSQAGCGLGCAYCATGQTGLGRNLDVWEIVEQVREVRRGLDGSLRRRVHGVVFQGMGEPLANAGAVIAAIHVLCESSAQAIDGRNITVCTAGLPAGILRLAREAPKVRLAISIGSARPEVRRQLMPVECVHPLETVLDAVAEHVRLTRLAPLWAVTLLERINDTEADARALAEHGNRLFERAGVRPQVSIVPYNPVAGPARFVRSGEESESAFRKVVRESGLSVRKRYSGGWDVNAACGQLVLRQSAPMS